MEYFLVSQPIKISEKFNYLDLKKTTGKDGYRVYHSPDNEKLVSVTTIISATSDKTFLDAWRKRVGEEAANEEVYVASGTGSLLHTHLEKYMLGEERPGGKNYSRVLAKDMADLIIKFGLCDISEIFGIEIPLYYPGLYAGTADLIAVYKNELSIIDFKNAKKKKKDEWVTDYYLQLCAYIMAHDEIFNTNIKKGVILLATRQREFQSFEIEGLQLDYFKKEWCKRLEQFFQIES